MRFTNKTTYSIEAMYYLAEKYTTNKPIPISEIAKSESISKTFLEKIFESLKKAGLVRSIKGFGGGYVLALPPAEISIIQILKALKEPVGPTICVEENYETRCQKSNKCVPKKIWENLRIHIENFLKNTTLEDLLKIKEELAQT